MPMVPLSLTWGLQVDPHAHMVWKSCSDVSGTRTDYGGFVRIRMRSFKVRAFERKRGPIVVGGPLPKDARFCAQRNEWDSTGGRMV